jgi:hypothetical protein
LIHGRERSNTAYLLKESFGQLWSYEREGWARRFFENVSRSKLAGTRPLVRAMKPFSFRPGETSVT